MCAGLLAVLILPTTSFAHGDSHERITALTAQIVSHPELVELLLQRAELHRQHGEYGLALADCQTAEKMDTKLIAVQYYRGKILFDAGFFAESRASLDRFLAVQRTHSEAFLVRARGSVKLKELERAAADFSSAIQFAPAAEPDYFVERAQALEAAGKIETALSGLDEGIAKLGPIVSLQLPAVDLDLKLARYDEALKRIDLLAAQSSRKEPWLLQRAKILEKSGRTEEARMAYANAGVAINGLPARLGKSDSVQAMQHEVSASIERLAARSPTK